MKNLLDKPVKKGIIRTILDNYRDVAMYERAVMDILMTIHTDTGARSCRYDSDGSIEYILDKICDLKQKVKDLELKVKELTPNP